MDADLPNESSGSELVVNLTAARTLGITVPESILVSANQATD
jgi:ABC-type uncharacterized transport system substrate-binding protein